MFLVLFQFKVQHVVLLFLLIKISHCCSPCDCENWRLTCIGLDITSFPVIPELVANELTLIEIYNTRINCLEPVEYGF